MEKIRNHRDLDVWKDSITLVTDIYRVTQDFPKDEMYVLTSQIRRAAISIPSNIAEGAARESSIEFKRFLNIALASLAELDTQLIIAENLKYMIIREDLTGKICKIRNYLSALIKKI